MEYRTMPHGGEKISTIGLGIACLLGTREETAHIVSEAIDNGINYFDLCANNRQILEGYDLAKVGDALAVGHYQKLNVHASACLQCGHCESRCPL